MTLPTSLLAAAAPTFSNRTFRVVWAEVDEDAFADFQEIISDCDVGEAYTPDQRDQLLRERMERETGTVYNADAAPENNIAAFIRYQVAKFEMSERARAA